MHFLFKVTDSSVAFYVSDMHTGYWRSCHEGEVEHDHVFIINLLDVHSLTYGCRVSSSFLPVGVDLTRR
jgi:hypothetical protein